MTQARDLTRQASVTINERQQRRSNLDLCLGLWAQQIDRFALAS
jgi:hypothetical protein